MLGFNDITYKFIIHVYTMDMYLNVKEHKIDKKKKFERAAYYLKKLHQIINLQSYFKNILQC